MKAIRIHKFGSDEVLQLEDVPIPEPASDELLVQVEAASLNRADLSLRKGSYRVSPKELPIIPGREFAGTVARVGSQVESFRVGQRVVAQPARGGYAEYALAKPVHTRAVPEGVDAKIAACVPTVFLTSWFGLVVEAGMKSGDTVLIQAGSSGVGVAAIQIAKHVGARVITTAGSDAKCRRLKDLGADAAINYVASDFKSEVLRLTGGRGVDVVLEMVGGDVYRRSLELLAPGGRLVSIGGAGGPIPDSLPSLDGGRRASRFSITAYLSAHPEGFDQMETFLELIRQGKFQVVIDRVFPLAEARAAQRYLEGREHFGKVVLTMK